MTQTAAPTALRTAEPPHRMRDRVPAQALIEQVLRARAALRPLTGLERLVGVDPLGPDAWPWYSGVLGERVVAGRLAGLPGGWTVLHSLPVGRDGGDIDHLVVGPGGVFTIDTKHHRDASAWVAGHAVLVAGRRRPYVQRAEAQARRVDRIVAGVLPEEPAVRPVVAFVGANA
ncbi:nuclease-related domain-containing protein, partial [Amnibacterium endophyticum]